MEIQGKPKVGTNMNYTAQNSAKGYQPKEHPRVLAQQASGEVLVNYEPCATSSKEGVQKISKSVQDTSSLGLQNNHPTSHDCDSTKSNKQS